MPWPRHFQPRRALEAAVVACVPLLLLREAIAGGALYRRDINMVWLPQVETIVRIVAGGAFPSWDPFSGFGRPLLADPRAEILYPPAWLNLVLSPAIFYTVFVVMHLALSGWGMRVLAGRLGASPPAALLAASVWMAGGPFLSLASMWHHLAAAAWIPWIVLAADELLDAPGVRSAVVCAGAVALQVLAGSPDMTAYTALILGVLAGERIWRGRHARTGARIAAAAGAVVLALGLAAAQWMPALDAARRSLRVAGSDAGTKWALHPLAAIEALVPLRWADLSLHHDLAVAVLGMAEPWMTSIYVGAGTIALCAAALAVSRTAWPLVIVAAVALMLALGAHTPLHTAVVALVPGFGGLRYPVKAMIAAAFACSLLAAMGLDACARSTAARRAACGVGILAAILALVAAALLSSGPAAPVTVLGVPFPGAMPVAPGVVTRLLCGAGAAAVAAGLALGASDVRARAALAILIGAELAWVHRDLNPTAPRALYAHRPAPLVELPAGGAGRTFVYDYSIAQGQGTATQAYAVARAPVGWARGPSLVLGVHDYLNPPTAARWGLYGSFDFDILEFDPPPLNRLAQRLRELEADPPAHARLLRVGGVTHALALVPAGWWQGLDLQATLPGFFTEPIRVMRVPDPLPRAYAVTGVRIAKAEAAVAMLTDPAFDAAREVVLASGDGRPPDASSPGTVSIVGLEADRVDLDTSLAAPAWVVLIDAYDPGWKATIDGNAVPVIPANTAFRAVHVPAGRHRVSYRYRPSAISAGATVSIAALGLAAAGLMASRRRSP